MGCPFFVSVVSELARVCGLSRTTDYVYIGMVEV